MPHAAWYTDRTRSARQHGYLPLLAEPQPRAASTRPGVASVLHHLLPASVQPAVARQAV